MPSIFSSLRDVGRAMLPGSERVLASFDHAVDAAERLSATAIQAAGSSLRYGVDRAVTYAKKPPVSILSQIQPTNVPQWDLRTIDDALEQHELGFFLQSSALADAMGRDDRIPGCRDTRVRALASKSGCGFSLTPSTRGKPKIAIDLAKEITEVWWYSIPETVLSRVLVDAVMLGVGFARIHWEKVDGLIVPRLEPWDAHTIYYDWSIRRYRAIGIEGQVIIDPGSAEWLIYEPANYRSWMFGAIRGLARTWMYRRWNQNDWSRYCEKHGNPIIAITEPTGNQWSTQKLALYNQIRNIGREGLLRLPKDDKGQGWDAKYLEPTSKSYGAFQEFLKRLDTNIAVMLLGQNLTTEVNGGSYAASMIHNLIRLDYLDADAESLSTALRACIWKPYVRFNHGQSDEEACPWPTWQTRPPEDMQARATILTSFSTALVPLVQAGVPVDVPRLAEKFEIPLTHDMRPIVLPPGGAPPVEWPDPSDDPNPPAPADDGTTTAPKAASQPIKAPKPGAAISTALVALSAPLPPTATRAYQQGRIRVSIDRPEGYVQRGVGSDGVPWARTYSVDYGYIDSTLGGDGESVDAYCGPDPDAAMAYWVAQVDDSGDFDEYKVLLGFDSQAEARECYLEHTPVRYLGTMFAMPAEAVAQLLDASSVARLTLLSFACESGAPVGVDGLVLLGASSAPPPVAMARAAMAEAAQTALHSVATLSPVALETWAAKQKSLALRTRAASTIRLLRLEVCAWDQCDIHTAKVATKTAWRLLRKPRSHRRDSLLMCLGVDPDEVPRVVSWHDRANVFEAERAAAVTCGALTSTHFAHRAASYLASFETMAVTARSVAKLTAMAQADVDDMLREKAHAHNASHASEAHRTTPETLRKVYDRGLAGGDQLADGDNEARAVARVNAFLHLLAHSRPEHRYYTADNDLLPQGHPKSTKAKKRGSEGDRPKALSAIVRLYNQDQARDEHGRFGEGSGAGGIASAPRQIRPVGESKETKFAKATVEKSSTKLSKAQAKADAAVQEARTAREVSTRSDDRKDDAGSKAWQRLDAKAERLEDRARQAAESHEQIKAIHESAVANAAHNQDLDKIRSLHPLDQHAELKDRRDRALAEQQSASAETRLAEARAEVASKVVEDHAGAAGAGTHKGNHDVAKSTLADAQEDHARSLKGLGAAEREHQKNAAAVAEAQAKKDAAFAELHKEYAKAEAEGHEDVPARVRFAADKASGQLFAAEHDHDDSAVELRQAKEEHDQNERALADAKQDYATAANALAEHDRLEAESAAADSTAQKAGDRLERANEAVEFWGTHYAVSSANVDRLRENRAAWDERRQSVLAKKAGKAQTKTAAA